jgi:hypothetical protein
MASMSPRVCKLVLWAIAAFYAYGALVHLMNMAGFSGFDWRTAPLKWQVLDIAYLGLDLVVVAGLVLGRRFGFIAFYASAASQIRLYTLLRAWILDVPEAFARSPDEIAYLDLLVGFHIVTVTAVLRLRTG